MENKSGCLVCGKPLEYYDTEREMTVSSQRLCILS